MNAQPTKSLVSRLDGAIWVLLLTALAYALAYTYEFGYLAFFGIPADFAEPNLRSVLICAAISIVGSLFVFYVVGVLLPLRPERMSERLKRDCAVVIVIPVVLVALLYLSDAAWWVWVSALAMIGGPPVLNILIAPVFEHRTVKGYLAKLEQAAQVRDTEAAANRQTSLGFWKYIDGKSFVVILCMVASPYLAYLIGHMTASHQIMFLVPNNNPCVVLRSRTEGLLCARFQTQTDATRTRYRVRCEYQFLKTEGTVLGRRHLGPLEGAETTAVDPRDLLKFWLIWDEAKRDALIQRMFSGGCPEDATAQSANPDKSTDQGVSKPDGH